MSVHDTKTRPPSFRIKDKNGETVFDLVSPEDTEIRTLLRKSQAQASISKDDVADGAFVRYCFPYCLLT